MRVIDVTFRLCATVHSAVDISQGILSGRPFGGTAILFGKALLGSISFIETHESRLSAVVLATSIEPVIILYVRICPLIMVTVRVFENNVYVCINVLHEECDAVHLTVAKDFNCCADSKSYE